MHTTFGSRLKAARKESQTKSAQWIVNFINGRLPEGSRAVSVSKYYRWEQIDHRVMPKGGYPHPDVYKLLAQALGVTLHWLMFGSMGGRVVRRTNELKQVAQEPPELMQEPSTDQQKAMLAEFERLVERMDQNQYDATLEFLKRLNRGPRK